MEQASEKNNYHYNPQLKEYARQLRNDMTKAEACLWKYVLKARNMEGYQFRRQRPVLNYIADFMCKELLLVIEVDGYTHKLDGASEKDQRRDKDLEAIGFTVLRFTDWEVLNRIMDVSLKIREWIKENSEANIS
ncbi:MAG: endonuclease domain-containing protein [Bacteroidota bacterium]